MQVYTMNVLSRRSVIVCFILFVCSMGVTLFSRGTPPEDKSIYFIVEGVVFFIFYLGFCTGETEWKVLDDGIHIRWTRQFLFHRKKELFIPLRDLVGFDYHADATFQSIKLHLASGEVTRFFRSNFTTSDDFKDLVAALQQQSTPR